MSTHLTGRQKIWAAVQARMSSRRLPGKVLAPVMGRPMLGLLLDRIVNCDDLDGVCVATSADASDDPIAAFYSKEGVACYRGELDDVALRMLNAADAVGADAFVRINGDSPLLDPRLISRAVGLFTEQQPDLVSNVLVRTFPKGQSVEVVRTEVLRNALPRFAQADEHEHVTLHFYRNAAAYRIVSFTRDQDASGVQLSVDTRQDFARLERVVGAFTRPHWTYGMDEILDLPETGPT